jgi:hypothetical protein
MEKALRQIRPYLCLSLSLLTVLLTAIPVFAWTTLTFLFTNNSSYRIVSIFLFVILASNIATKLIVGLIRRYL